MPLTEQNRDNTLNYWWGLDEHKNMLINWQRQNTRETLINNRNRVHAERRRLVQLLLQKTVTGCQYLSYRRIVASNLGYDRQPYISSIPNDVQTGIQLNLPHSVFVQWLDSHNCSGHYEKHYHSTYLSNFGSIPFLPEHSPIPEYIIFIKNLKSLISSKTTTIPVFISYKLDKNHTFTKSLEHFKDGILDKIKTYNYIPKIASDSLTPAQCDALIAELKITKPVKYSPRLTVGKLKEIAEHTLYNESTPLSEFFIVGENLLVTGEGYSKPQVGDLHLEFLIQAVPN